MVSESLPTDGIENVSKTKHERVSINRLRKFGAYITMAATLGTMTAIEAGRSLEVISDINTEVARFSNLNADLGQPMVVLPEICLDVETPNFDDIKNSKKSDKKIESELSLEESTAKIFATPPAVEATEGWFDQVANFGQNQIRQAQILTSQITGAIDTLNHIRYQQGKYRSQFSGVEFVFSGQDEFKLQPDNLELLEKELLNPANYHHSEQRKLIECVRRELVDRRIHENSRIHVVVGGPETMIKDFRIQSRFAQGDSEHGGAAIPINLIPLPKALEAEVLIITTPSKGGEQKLNTMFAHELYHAYMHLIDLPIRMNPDERQAEIAERFILNNWLSEARYVITYP